MVLRYCVIIKTTLIAYVIMLMRLPEHLRTVTVCGSNEQRVHKASSPPCPPGAGMLALHPAALDLAHWGF